jgi:hypothetical protein
MTTMPTRIDRVLAGETSYDMLADTAQAFVRMSWNQQVAERIDTLDFADQLRATGQPWVETDADGPVVVREPRPAGA